MEIVNDSLLGFGSELGFGFEKDSPEEASDLNSEEESFY